MRIGKYFKIIDSVNNYHKIKFEVRVIEYQRRGLPHAHLVFKFEDKEMPLYSDKDNLSKWIDHHISAVYPRTTSDEEPLDLHENYEEDLEYAEIVKNHMIHKCFAECNGGCLNEKNVCSKGFDKNIVTNVTLFDEKGFPQYKRPTVRSVYVVPHNKYLLKDWNGRANVEFAGSVYTVIYLYKYLFKGSKKVKLQLTNADDVNNNNEIKLYIRGRYLCAMDCYWRILGHETYPAPTPSVRIIKIVSEQNSAQSLSKGNTPDIIIYFIRPSELQNLKYTELFNKYTWSYNRPHSFHENDQDCYIVKTAENAKNIYLYKRCFSKPSITRLETIAVMAGEIFFLRLILYNFPKQSYKDCFCFNDTMYATYQEAAVAAGIVKDHDEIYSCFQEAEQFQNMTPAELRTLFVISTLQGFPTLKILNEQRFKYLLYDDFLHQYNPPNHHAAWNDLLCDFSNRFESDGKNMTDYGLPQPRNMKKELEIERHKYDSNEQLLYYNKLCDDVQNTVEQQEIFDEIINAVESKSTKIFYIQGQAGSGKTTLAKKIMAYCRSQQKLCAGCASTGLAASLYEGFETAHSLFKFPVIEDDEREIDTPVECNLLNSSNRLEYLQSVDLILWDEFPSCDREVFEAAYQALNRFQDKVIVTMGDMRQIAPVVVHGDKVDVINHSIPSSPLWKEFTIKKLTKNMRLLPTLNDVVRNEEEQIALDNQRAYAEMILAIGNGIQSPEMLEKGYTCDKSRGATTVELPHC